MDGGQELYWERMSSPLLLGENGSGIPGPQAVFRLHACGLKLLSWGQRWQRRAHRSFFVPACGSGWQTAHPGDCFNRTASGLQGTEAGQGMGDDLAPGYPDSLGDLRQSMSLLGGGHHFLTGHSAGTSLSLPNSRPVVEPETERTLLRAGPQGPGPNTGFLPRSHGDTPPDWSPKLLLSLSRANSQAPHHLWNKNPGLLSIP